MTFIPKNCIYWHAKVESDVQKYIDHIGTHFTDFVDAQLESGRFNTTSEVVRAGLRLLEEHETKVKALRDALIAGEQSGEPREFDNAAFLKRMRDKHVG